MEREGLCQRAGIPRMTENGENPHAIWRQNARLLYSYLVSDNTTWPVLSFDWLFEGNSETPARIALGSNALCSGDNHISIVGIDLDQDAFHLPDHSANPETFQYTQVIRKIPHDMEVNKLRASPHRANALATQSASGYAYLFDLDTDARNTKPSLQLCSHLSPSTRMDGSPKEGFALEWSHTAENHLATGGKDGVVALFDLQAQPVIITTSTNDPDQPVRLAPLLRLEGHTDEIEDVAFHRADKNVLGSVGDDKTFAIWDIRTGQCEFSGQAHSGNVNSIDFNAFSDYIFCTASSDASINIWDMRQPKQPRYTMHGHEGEIYSVSWSPTNASVLASSGTDMRVNIYDLLKIGDEQTHEDIEEGNGDPPELLFSHQGHNTVVTDVRWHPTKPWYLASSDEDSLFWSWRPASYIYSEEQPEYLKDDLEPIGFNRNPQNKTGLST